MIATFDFRAGGFDFWLLVVRGWLWRKWPACDPLNNHTPKIDAVMLEPVIPCKNTDLIDRDFVTKEVRLVRALNEIHDTIPPEQP